MLKGRPFLKVALSVAILSCAAFALMYLADNRRWFPDVLKPLLLPGIVPLYVVGTLTNSEPLGLVAFVVGTFITYAFVGWLGDQIWEFIKAAADSQRRPDDPVD